MKLRLVRGSWGAYARCGGDRFSGLEEFLDGSKESGYELVEVPVVCALEVGLEKFKGLLKDRGMRVAFQMFTDGVCAPGAAQGHPVPGDSVAEHLAVFHAQVEAAIPFEPVYINSHSGRDFFTRAESTEFFNDVIAYQKDVMRDHGIPIYHETHRCRILYSPWVTRDLLPDFPELQLVADISHWAVVTELPHSDPKLMEIVKQIAPQVKHIHARVGWAEGPQVPDPRSEHFKEDLEGFDGVCDVIWRAQAEKGVEESTLMPEHGPWPYQPVNPADKKPLAEIWDVNTFIGERLKGRFESKAWSK